MLETLGRSSRPRPRRLTALERAFQPLGTGGLISAPRTIERRAGPSLGLVSSLISIRGALIVDLCPSLVAIGSGLIGI